MGWLKEQRELKARTVITREHGTGINKTYADLERAAMTAIA